MVITNRKAENGITGYYDKITSGNLAKKLGQVAGMYTDRAN